VDETPETIDTVNRQRRVHRRAQRDRGVEVDTPMGSELVVVLHEVDHDTLTLELGPPIPACRLAGDPATVTEWWVYI
jgi:hypothetical protein